MDPGTGGITNSEHYTIDPNTFVVTQLSDAPWPGCHTFCQEYLGGKIYKWSYDNSTGTFDKSLWSYDVVNGWVQVLTDTGLGNRQAMFYGTDGEYLICGGGAVSFGFSQDNSPYANIWRWKPGMLAFEKIADFTLPEMNGTNHTGLEHGCFRVFKGAWWIRGGGKFWRAADADPGPLPFYANPYVFKSVDNGVTWTIAATLQASGYWGAVSNNSDAMAFYHANTGGDNEERNLIELTEDGVNWLKLSYSAGKRHAIGMCATTNDFVFGCGSGEQSFNDLWMIKKIK